MFANKWVPQGSGKRLVEMELRILCFLSVPKLTSLNRKFLLKVLFIDSVQVLSKRKSFETATLFERENYHYVLKLSESNHLVHMW